MPPLFTPKDIADYYNQTLPHYRIWWKLNRSKSIHYGIWDDETTNFQKALQIPTIKWQLWQALNQITR